MVSRVMFALLFVAWVGEWPREIDGALYSGLWRSPFEVFGPLFVPLPGIRMFAWQLLLVALVPFCVATPGALRHRAREMDAAILVSLGSIAITFLWGWLRGGAPYYAYYQIWRFPAGLLVGYLLISAIKAPRDLRILAMTVMFAALIRGTLVMYFYWVHVHGKINPPPETMTNHDDSLLFVTAILIVGTWAAFNGRKVVWKFAIGVSLYLFYAMVLNNRRIAWVELATAAVAIYVLIGASPMRRRINRWLVMAAPFILVYAAVGWGREEALFAPIQAFSSIGSDYDASSLGRQEEIRNLLYTMSVTGNAFLGAGWGVPYQKLTSIYSNYTAEVWALAFYTPHNSLVGLATFAGLLGIVGIWGVVPVAAYLAARGYKRSADPTRRTAAMATIGILTAYSVHCYGDIGIQAFSCAMILGIAIATASKVSAWSAVTASVRQSPVPGRDSTPTRGASPATPTALGIRIKDRLTLPRAIPTAARDRAVQSGPASARRSKP